MIISSACKDDSSTSSTNNPPNPPESLIPVTGSTEVSVNPTLDWECTDPDGDPLNYDIYFDTLNPPSLLISNWPNSDYTIADSLNYQTSYYWQVAAFDLSGGRTESDVAAFTTARAMGIYEVARIATESSALDVYVIRDEVYIAEGSYGIEIYDISTPATPFEIESYQYYQLYADNILVDGNFAYIADASNEGLLIVDISNPYIPVTAAFLVLPTAVMPHDVALSSDRAYLAGDTAGVQVVTIYSSYNPQLETSLDLGSATIESIDILGNYAVLGGLGRGIFIVDISDPGSPALVGEYNTTGGVEAVSIEQVDGSMYVHVADGSDGYCLIDITQPDSPTLITSLALSGYAYDVCHLGDYTYLAVNTSGLVILDDSIPPNIIASYNTIGQAKGLAIADGYIYVADGQGGVQILEFVE